MTIKDYQNQSKRSMKRSSSRNLDTLHMIIGMFSEYNEVQAAIEKNDLVNMQEEIIDVMWYLSNYCTLNKIDLNIAYNDVKKQNVIILSTNHINKLFCHNMSLLQDYHKKCIFYKKPSNHIIIYELVLKILSNLLSYINCYNLDLEKGLENNINKLKVRYPSKFKNSNALSRNIEKELEELKK